MLLLFSGCGSLSPESKYITLHVKGVVSTRVDQQAAPDPVADAEITLWYWYWGAQLIGTYKTDENGRFEITKTNATSWSTYSIQVCKPGFRDAAYINYAFIDKICSGVTEDYQPIFEVTPGPDLYYEIELLK